ncbi:putative disease resistance protein RGA3 [Ananas comosus]|uniref:Disease resistance protein RGA3 n=1 Tax=Ananas comosus TaxID=4615 RepID=A0A6P5FLN4_ANACO|nr:putative disease resistance protein RGA3 [Ananas comosus]
MSQVLESDTVGTDIETDTDNLVKMLTEKEKEDHLLFAIVGLGGIGKTTLAKRINENERIRGVFEIILWVCVSKDLSDTSLLTKIIDLAGGDSTEARFIAQLEPILAKTIAQKRFLLVLDDVWDAQIWEDLLKTPLKDGARGSRVLITTRYESVAKKMGAVHVHNVKQLSTEHGWMLLSRSVTPNEEEIHNLRNIGKKIVGKCNGLPLAIKTIAGVLRTRERSKKEWKRVYESKSWSWKELPPQEVMGALYLSYNDLPPHLRQCFLYCSLFPADFTINRRILIQQWISEGLVEMKKDDSTLEEIAEEYCNELVVRNLLQIEHEYHNGKSFKMHTLLQSLAQFLSREEIFKDDLEFDLSSTTRRVSLASKEIMGIPNEVKKQESLRTLLLSMNPLKGGGLDDVFVKLRCLRVLDLSETAIKQIPDTLRNLVHLRYLNLSSTRLREIPESIRHLWNLQFLGLKECKRLRALPKGLEQLRRLRSLDLAGTEISDVPFKIGKLKLLNTLSGFVVNGAVASEEELNGCTLEEIKHLSELRTLQIVNLERAMNHINARGAELKNKPHLTELELGCSSESRDYYSFELPTTIKRVEEIFEELCPPPCLESLKITNYFGTKYPSWISTALLPNLRRLDLSNCRLCRRLPPLGQLPKLKFLSITDSYVIEAIGDEMVGTEEQVAFPKLEKFHIRNMANLANWSGFETGTLPLLQSFQLESCPKVRSLPDGLQRATALRELWVVDAKILEVIENLETLEELSVWNTPRLEKITNLPSLKELSISYCPALKTVETIGSLRRVHIYDYDMQEIPQWVGLNSSTIRSLDLACSDELLKRCTIGGANWELIKDIEHVHGYSTKRSRLALLLREGAGSNAEPLKKCRSLILENAKTSHESPLNATLHEPQTNKEEEVVHTTKDASLILDSSPANSNSNPKFEADEVAVPSLHRNALCGISSNTEEDEFVDAAACFSPIRGGHVEAPASEAYLN